MKKQELKAWENSVNKILNSCLEFRKMCNAPFDRGFIGELLVLNQILKTYGDKLCSSDKNKIIYAGSSNKGWDFELSLGSKKIKIDAKATTTTVSKNDKTPKWVRQQAGKFCEIKIEKNSKQRVFLNKKNTPGMFYIYVDVVAWLDNRTPQFFTLSDKEVKAVFGRKYRKLYNRRVRESKSTDFWVEHSDIKNFKDQRLIKLLK